MSKKAVEAGEIVDGLEILRMDPNELQLDQNVRKDTRLTGEFLSSIRTLGVQAPVLAYRDLLGQVLVVDGQRRVLAARQEGLASVPVMISQAPGSPEHTVLRQVSLNEARTGLLTSELTDAVWQLSLFGMEPETIAAQIGRKPAEVRHLLRVAESKAAKEVAREVPELTIPQAAALAELEDNEAVDDERFDRVVDAIAADPDQADHILSRARLDAQVESAFRVEERRWRAEGVRVLRASSEEYKALGYLPRFTQLVLKKTGKPMTDKEVMGCEGLIVVLHEDRDGVSVSASLECHGPEKYGLCREWELPSSTRRGKKEKSEEQRQAEVEERRRVIENNKASDAAKEVRWEFVKELVARGVRGLERLFVEFNYRKAGRYGQGEWRLLAPEVLLEDAGLLPTNVTARGWASSSAKNAQKVLLASMICTIEADFLRDFWRNVLATNVDRGAFARPEVTLEVWYLRWLQGEGYSLSPIELEHCEAVEAAVAKAQAEVEKRAQDGGK